MICRAASKRRSACWVTKSSTPTAVRRRPIAPDPGSIMPVPILKHGEMLIASMQSNLDDQDLMQLKDEIAEKVGRFKSRGVVLDVSILDVLDSFATRTLQSIAETARLRGAETVIVGIQPDVAIAMVQLGLTLDGVLTALDFEEGMELLLASIGGSRPGGS